MFLDKIKGILGKKQGAYDATSILDRGRKFEIFIGRYFYDSGDFELLKKPGQKIKGHEEEFEFLPDFKIRDKKSKKEFWLECKWRANWTIENKVEKTYFREQQIKPFQELQKTDKHKVFIALGIGTDFETNDELRPKELYFFPINMLSDYVSLRKSYLMDGDRLHDFKYKKPKFFQAYHDLK